MKTTTARGELTKEAAHAARRLETCRTAYAAAPTPAARLGVAFDWFRAVHPSDRTINMMAEALMKIAERADKRTAGQ